MPRPYTRLGAEGFGVRRYRGFNKSLAVFTPEELAHVLAVDALVTLLAVQNTALTTLATLNAALTGLASGTDATVTGATLDDGVVTNVSITEWPV